MVGGGGSLLLKERNIKAPSGRSEGDYWNAAPPYTSTTPGDERWTLPDPYITGLLTVPASVCLCVCRLDVCV